MIWDGIAPSKKPCELLYMQQYFFYFTFYIMQQMKYVFRIKRNVFGVEKYVTVVVFMVGCQ